MGALNPVNHKGLRQGWTQTSLYHQVIHSTSHVFWAYFVFRGHSTREPASSRLTYFTLRAYTGTSVSHTANTGKNQERFWKNTGEWTGRVDKSKEEIHGSKRRMYGYITDVLQALKGECLSCILTRWDFNSASAAPHCGMYLIKPHAFVLNKE